MVSKAAEKSTATGRAMTKTATTALVLMVIIKEESDLPSPKPPTLAAKKNDVPIEMTDKTAVKRDAVRTRKNLPRTRWVRSMGLVRMVSMVPRSFSPAVGSIAGYHPRVFRSGINLDPLASAQREPPTLF